MVNYVCDKCKHEWAGQKLFGDPMKDPVHCPKCRSGNIRKKNIIGTSYADYCKNKKL